MTPKQKKIDEIAAECGDVPQAWLVAFPHGTHSDYDAMVFTTLEEDENQAMLINEDHQTEEEEADSPMCVAVPLFAIVGKHKYGGKK